MLRSGELVPILLIGYLAWVALTSHLRGAEMDGLLRVMDQVHYGIREPDREALAHAIVSHVPKEYRMVMLALAFHESSFRRDALGDNGTSFGMFQLRKGALEDVRQFVKSSFPVPDNWDEVVQEDIEYAVEGAWRYLYLNLVSPSRAKGDLALALTMHRTGPDRGRAQALRSQGEAILDTARLWERMIGWNRLR